MKTKIEDAQAFVAKMESKRSALQAEFEAYDRMYLVNPIGENEGKVSAIRVKPLYDSHPHNTVNTLINMFVGKPPMISVPVPQIGAMKETKNYTEKREAADRCEKFLKTLFIEAAQISNRNHLVNTLASMALYGEINLLPVNLLADEIEDAPVPFTFKVPHPGIAYPQVGDLGLTRHAIVEAITIGEARDFYGKLWKIDGSDETPIHLVDYMDKWTRYVYPKEKKDELVIGVEHHLPFIPRVYRRGDFPTFFKDDKYQNIPFLFAVKNSGAYGARNLALTMMNTNIYDFLNPLWVSYTRDKKPIPIQWGERGTTLPLFQDEKIEPMAKNLVPNEQFTFFSIVSQLVEDATMSRIARGTMPSGAQWAASAINILAESTRMSANRISEPVEVAWSQALTIVLRWIKARGDTVVVSSNAGDIIIKPSDIFDDFRVQFKLKPDQAVERQMVIGTIAQLWDRHLIGYEMATAMLESAGVADSSSDLMRDILYRGALEAELPNLMKELATQGRQIIEMAEKIPETPIAPQTGGGSGVESMAGYAPRNPLEMLQDSQMGQPQIPGAAMGMIQ